MQECKEGASTLALYRIRTALTCLAIWIVGGAIAIKSYDAIAAIIPGRVLVDTWRYFASAMFLTAGASVAWFVLKSRHSTATKVVLITFFGIISLWFGLMMQLHFNCGDEPVYIGEKSAPDEESCSA